MNALDQNVEAREVIDGRTADSSEARDTHKASTPGEIQDHQAKRRRRESNASTRMPRIDAEEAGTERHADANDAVGNRETGPMTIDDGVGPADRGVAKPAEVARGLDDHSHSQTPEVPGPKVRKINHHKGGSVALIRRKIIMDTVDKAGGAFPWGTALWYPYTTAWEKMKHKEIPDWRTVKSVTKHLIDAGKLRQMTFSGKDSKGVMVTKSIVTKPEMQPDDPVIKDLQTKMLAEPKLYIPPSAEVNHAITKVSARKKGRDPRPLGPVETTGMTVQLHRKPAAVLADERRRGRRIQRQLMQSIDFEARAAKPGRSRVVRLMKLHRASSQAPTSIARPGPGGDEGGMRAPNRIALVGETAPLGFQRVKNLWHPVSTIAPYAMFLNPRQSFHQSSGTFSTDAGVAAFQTRKVTRDKPVARAPDSLDDLLRQARRRKRAAPAGNANRFFQESDTILRWELENEDALLKEGMGIRYINQTVHRPFEVAEVEGAIRFDNEEEEQPLAPPAEPMTTRRKARRRSAATGTQEAPSPSPPQPTICHPKTPGRRRRHQGTPEVEEIEGTHEDEFQQEGVATTEVPAMAPPSRRLAKLNESVNTDEFGSTATVAPAYRPITRRRFAGQLPQSVMQRIMTAIAVVRTLAGGFEGRLIDWNLIPKGFPNHDPKMIQDRARSLLSKNRLQIAKMQSDFQERFIEAYAKDEVPRIDYGDLEGYDWEGVIAWAHSNLDAPSSQKLPDLPATREQFDSLFAVREEAPGTVDELYQITNTVTINRKRALHAGVAFAIPLLPNARPRRAELSRLDVAKTWIRANVTAPEETYRSTEAFQALRRFEDPLVESAVQSLVTERVISMGNRGRITPGRNYDITDHFLSTLGRRRTIEHTQIRRAARFKTRILDPELQARGIFDVSYHAEDGDILTLINLAATGRVVLKPRDPPNDKFGLTEGGYVTRQMDKEKLRFTVVVQPIAGSYVYGNPLHDRTSSVPPPCPHRNVATASASLPEKIPIWVDIHGQFNKLLWELVVGAVVGCVAMRPGISAAAIAAMIKPTMGTWEVQMLLEWMAAVGMARQENKEKGGEEPGWMVEEWWWMVLE